MQAKIYITTFRKGENQGQLLEVATLDLEVIEKKMTLVRRDGCISGELLPDQLVKIVKILNREFVVERGWGMEFGKSGAEYQVSIPPELAGELDQTICPHCGKLINSI